MPLDGGRISLKSFENVFNNVTLWVAILAWAVAQFIKFTVEFIRHKKISLRLLFSSGGMPSSHTSFVTSMATSVGLKDGFASTQFALSAILSLIVMYDAAGVRRAAGKHAAAINSIFDSFENTGIAIDIKLKELLGHSPVEVAAGAVLGVLIGAIFVR
jgi:acid phosphatase family membrane protein YuiD